jgi:DNA-binding protein HU-beta/integration host factor subunit alpha
MFPVVQKTLDYITESLAKGGKDELRKFGVFDVKIRKARAGLNPQRPEINEPIPALSMVKFKVGKEMRAQVLKLSTRLENGFLKQEGMVRLLGSLQGIFRDARPRFISQP